MKEGVHTYLDESLKRFETVYPAAGSANSAVRLTPQELEQCIENVTWMCANNLETCDNPVRSENILTNTECMLEWIQ